MKRYNFIFLLLFSILISILYYIFLPVINDNKISILSPLPNFLTILENKQVTTLSIFLPKIKENNIFGASIKKPNIEAKSAFIYDLKNKEALYTKNIYEKIPMASLTKIMTAVIALENPKKTDKYLVSKEDLVGEDSMGLTAGEILSLDELLYGMLLNSGNDAAETLAANFPGGREKFVKAMNDKAKALGLKNTNFTNPSGLQGDGNQFTTAYDLFIITNYAISNFPKFREIVSTFRYDIPYTEDHKAFYLENETNLLTSYPGVKGVKTGYTPEAGLCLVTYLEYEGHKIIGVLLGSNNRREEMRELLDYSLELRGIKPPMRR